MRQLRKSSQCWTKHSPIKCKRNRNEICSVVERVILKFSFTCWDSVHIYMQGDGHYCSPEETSSASNNGYAISQCPWSHLGKFSLFFILLLGGLVCHGDCLDLILHPLEYHVKVCGFILQMLRQISHEDPHDLKPNCHKSVLAIFRRTQRWRDTFTKNISTLARTLLKSFVSLSPMFSWIMQSWQKHSRMVSTPTL